VRAASVAAPVSVDVKKLDGSAAGSASVSLRVADASTATGVVHRYLTLVRQNLRQGSANTKTRSEVRGGGKKPYAQKGTGGARQGSKRTPLRPGGGVAFGPKPRDFSISMNKKEKRLAMATALQSAAANNMVVVEDMSAWAEVKTSKLVATLKAVGADCMTEQVLLVTGDFVEAVAKSGRNVAKLTVSNTDNLNVVDVLRAKTVVVDQKALEKISEYFGENGDAFKSHYVQN
jgi:large subunit ribosomal protein L4